MQAIEKIFPIAIIVLSVGAAVTYGVVGDWRRAGYFLSGALITFFAIV